jgi:AcrR family transcriptional regulator
MDEAVNSGRRYDSPVRREQARRTRRRILDAATASFAERGYAATTIRAVAVAAGVAVPTVEAAFRTKANLLKEVVDVTIAGDDEPVPIMERPVVRDMLAAPDPVRMFALHAAFVRDINERHAAVYEAVRNAAPSHPEIAALWAKMEDDRHVGGREATALLRARGWLRPDLSLEESADILWVMQDPTLYLDLVRGRGWAPERYETWLAGSLRAMLLGAPG